MKNQLKELRLQCNLTQKQVAEAINITERNYQRLEAGENPSYTTFIALADYFSVSLDYLAERQSTITSGGSQN